VLTASGTFDAAGSTLGLSAGTVTLSPGCNVAGTTVNVGGGVLNFNTSSPVGTLNLTAGTLGGSRPVAVSGSIVLGGGTVTNARVEANGGLTIQGNVTLDGATLVNFGDAFWTAGNFNAANGAVISNLLGGTFVTTFDGNMNVSGATPSFVNVGTFRKTGATAPLGNTSIDARFLNLGVVEVQTNTLRLALNEQMDGQTVLNGGSLAAQAEPLQFLGGRLIGAGSLTVANNQSVINSALVSPGSPLGELAITGNYLQTAEGNLDIELGGYTPGVDADLISVTAGGAGGVATLGGTLKVTLANGFSPTNGATFTFLTAVSRVGAFAAFNYPSNDLGMQLTTDATSATLKVTNLKPVVAHPVTNPGPITYGSPFAFQFPADTFADPDGDPLAYAVSGLPSGLEFVAATRTFTGAPTQAGVFTVAVVANDGGSPNLTATNSFLITVNPAPLSIIVDAQIKSYGAPDPPLSYTVTGLVLPDTSATVLSGAPSRAPGEAVADGPYLIGLGTLAANSNYTIAFTSNMLTILSVPLTVTAEDKSKVYGAPDPALTASYAGFVNGETASVLGGALTLVRAPGESVGSYAITPGGLTSGNYAITFSPGTLGITKAGLTVTAEDKSKVYGAPDPALTASYAGFVKGETASVLGGALTLVRAPGESVGSYAITPGGLTSGNYAITFSPGTLEISAHPAVSVSVALDGAAGILISWNAVSNVTYRAQYASDVAAVAWTDLPGDVLASGGEASKQDADARSPRFYRVRVLP
jgi:hypothetical protein